MNILYNLLHHIIFSLFNFLSTFVVINVIVVLRPREILLHVLGPLVHAVSLEHLLVQEGRHVDWVEASVFRFLVVSADFLSLEFKPDNFFSVFIFLSGWLEELLLHNFVFVIDLVTNFRFDRFFCRI